MDKRFGQQLQIRSIQADPRRNKLNQSTVPTMLLVGVLLMSLAMVMLAGLALLGGN
jgi:hypothetical protein